MTGFIGTFAVTFAALSLPLDSFAKVIFSLPRFILSPISDLMASWPGLINILLGATVNGVVTLLIFWLAALIVKKKYSYA